MIDVAREYFSSNVQQASKQASQAREQETNLVVDLHLHEENIFAAFLFLSSPEINPPFDEERSS